MGSNGAEMFDRYGVADTAEDTSMRSGARTSAKVTASVRQHSRNTGHTARSVYRHGPLELDLEVYRLRMDGHEVALTAHQIRLLEHFMRQPDRVFTRSELLAIVCGRQADERMPEAVDVHVCRLRRRLGDAGDLIETVRFIGYRLRGRTDDGSMTSRRRHR